MADASPDLPVRDFTARATTCIVPLLCGTSDCSNNKQVIRMSVSMSATKSAIWCPRKSTRCSIVFNICSNMFLACRQPEPSVLATLDIANYRTGNFQIEYAQDFTLWCTVLMFILMPNTSPSKSGRPLNALALGPPTVSRKAWALHATSHWLPPGSEHANRSPYFADSSVK